MMNYRVVFRHKREQTWKEYTTETVSNLALILKLIRKLREEFQQYEWKMVGTDDQIGQLRRAH